MLTPSQIQQKLQGTFRDDQAQALAEVFVESYAGLATSVDMQDLKDVVKDLALAQQRTETRLERLENVVESLALAQQRTEARLETLAAAQQRTEESIQRLANRVEILSDGLDDTRKQLGGLSMTVGYTLENEAYKALPALLKADFGLDVQGELTRTFVLDDANQPLEVNIVGHARKNGRDVTILGESKAQLSKNDIDRFLRRKIDRLRNQFDDIFLILITHMTTAPDVEAYAKEKGIALYYSYHF